jgi:ribonuclease P/MRP protein subunit POP3
MKSLLSPIGHYRAEHVQPSRGKRQKKRKRQELNPAELPSALPPAPEITSCIDVGFTTVTRHLQNTDAKMYNPDTASGPATNLSIRSYSAIFVARSGQPSILASHLPQMVATASRSHPLQQPTRLVGLSKACGDRREWHFEQFISLPSCSRNSIFSIPRFNP